MAGIETSLLAELKSTRATDTIKGIEQYGSAGIHDVCLRSYYEAVTQVPLSPILKRRTTRVLSNIWGSKWKSVYQVWIKAQPL